MAAIDDLIAKVEDKNLRQRLKDEAENLARQKKFGLVYEKHIPELTPIYNAKVRRLDRVALRDKPFEKLWRVEAVAGGKVTCSSESEQQVFPEKELVVVRQFGEPVFPVLTPIDKVQNGPSAAPWHTLIEADNYHALQLLEYLYFGQIDCIYIDPPYNTGARDWKYNNDYIDVNDSWRHSKWLSFMEKRLLIAKKLLKDDGVLIVTIDRVELCSLGLLLEDLFPQPQYEKTIVTIVIHDRGTEGLNFDRTEEYALFLTRTKERTICRRPLDGYNSLMREDDKAPSTRSFLRTGSHSTPAERPGMYYPIWIEPSTSKIQIGSVCSVGEKPEGPKNFVALYPEDQSGGARVWRTNPEGARKALQEKRLTAVQSRGRWILRLTNYKLKSVNHRTVWTDKSHATAAHGTKLLNQILGEKKFQYPKSLYSTRDCIAAAVANRPKARILDFFAGSGTTLHAVNLINAFDDGARSCIMVTNNEVSAEEQKRLKKKGSRPGQEAWDKHGICRSVTWPRSKYTILGKRDDGTKLDGGGYAVGKTTVQIKPRNFTHISITSADKLSTLAGQKELLTLVGGFNLSSIESSQSYLIHEEKSIIFDTTCRDEYLRALGELDPEDLNKILSFYIVSADKRKYEQLKQKIQNLAGGYKRKMEEKRPMQDGFPANLEYFRLDFLDKDHVRLGRQFREILPLLWLRAGACGSRPELPKNKPLPSFLIQADNGFAVLLDEGLFAAFTKQIDKAKTKLNHVFLVTDSDELFQHMASHLPIPNVIQLYREYLENFTINKGGAST